MIKIIPNKTTKRRIFRSMTNLVIAVCLSAQFWPLLPRFNRLSQRIPIVVGFSSISICSRELRFTVRPKQEATCSSRGMSESCGKSVPLLGPTSTYLANPLSSYRDCYLGLPSISTFTTKDALFREWNCVGRFVRLSYRSTNMVFFSLRGIHEEPEGRSGIDQTEQLSVANLCDKMHRFVPLLRKPCEPRAASK